MKIQIEVNGKKIDAYVNDNEMTAALKTSKTGYERAKINEVYCYERCGVQTKGREVDFSLDEYRYKSNYYTDCNVAENNIRADVLMRNLRCFAAVHGGCAQPRAYGWAIFWNDDQNGLDVTPLRSSRAFGAIRFTESLAALSAIEKFRDELVWYFTEYNPMSQD